ncbi:type II toxin-antitoxin system VapC family toxin [Candidatus Woesearchaeota archaeon]|nr:type II toxin-antitoxin system VapC family toxin [Candidatus Woesearchaeota archaeon]
MIYILDTSVLIGMEKQNKELINKITHLIGKDDTLYLTTLSYSEFYYGCLNKGEDNQRKALVFLDKFKLLTLSKESAKRNAELSYEYEKKGARIAEFDLLTAAIAIENNAVLVTADTDFERIAQLKKKVIAV